MEEVVQKKCGCPCHKAGGILIVLIGVVFLLGNLEVISSQIVGIVWPSLIILGGLKLTFKSMCKCCHKA